MQPVKYETVANLPFTKINNCVVELITSVHSENNSTLHWHHAVELIYVIEGRVHYFIEGIGNYAEKGDTILVNSGLIHQTENAENGKKLATLLIMIPAQVFNELVPDIQFPHFKSENVSDTPELKEYMGKIIEHLDPCQPFWDLYMKKEILNIIYLLYRSCFSSEKPQCQRSSLWKNIIKYVGIHYSEQITISDIAKKAGFQEHYFCRLFKKETGISFHQYLSRVRLDVALNLAVAKPTEYTLLDCALAAGFNTEKTLIDWCTKIYSCTPTEFIALSKKKSQSGEFLTEKS